MDVREKYKDVIIAWANGETIQFRMGNTWKDIEGTPLWEEGNEYRVKPKTKVFYLGLESDKDGVQVTNKFSNIEIQVEDGKIINVTLLKAPVVDNTLDKVTCDSCCGECSNKKEALSLAEELVNELEKLEKDKALKDFLGSVKFHIL